mmetsp:Transcript_52233/g.138433  ORF Transcript_52233/g.138433 Transcript_52233/m.138433 type:complete len:364 (-) Transcript_52233:459-1550(-)
MLGGVPRLELGQGAGPQEIQHLTLSLPLQHPVALGERWLGQAIAKLGNAVGALDVLQHKEPSMWYLSVKFLQQLRFHTLVENIVKPILKHNPGSGSSFVPQTIGPHLTRIHIDAGSVLSKTHELLDTVVGVHGKLPPRLLAAKFFQSVHDFTSGVGIPVSDAVGSFVNVRGQHCAELSFPLRCHHGRRPSDKISHQPAHQDLGEFRLRHLDLRLGHPGTDRTVHSNVPTSCVGYQTFQQIGANGIDCFCVWDAHLEAEGANCFFQQPASKELGGLGIEDFVLLGSFPAEFDGRIADSHQSRQTLDRPCVTGTSDGIREVSQDALLEQEAVQATRERVHIVVGQAEELFDHHLTSLHAQERNSC